MRGFYVAQPDMRVPRTGERIVVGETVTIADDVVPVIYYAGLHASVSVLDTLLSRGFGCLTLVDVTGDLVASEGKICGRARKTIKALSVKRTERLLREIACANAELVLQWGCYDVGLEPDQRLIDVIDVARRFARGRATPRELVDARHAAFMFVMGPEVAVVASGAGHAAQETACLAAAFASARAAQRHHAYDAAWVALHNVADRMALDALGGAK